jgi:beta-lactamase regulating signal transducer with metallopeptidase domain
MPFSAVVDPTTVQLDTFVTRKPPIGMASAAAEGSEKEPSPSLSYLSKLLACVWAVGCLGLWGAVGYRYRQLVRTMSVSESVDEGPLRIVLEATALGLKLQPVPELFTTRVFTSPFLCGVICPRIVVPQPLIEELSDDELHAVVLHELVHWKRRDPWVGWLQLIAQGLFWFHPLVWWANSQLRHARETACDETVLQLERFRPQQYGEALVRTLTASRGRSLVAGSLVGVFERGTKLQNRLEEIMNYESGKRRFGWMSYATLAIFAALFLPMAASVAKPVPTSAAGGVTPIATDDQADQPANESTTPYPLIVRTVPKSGATNVDPAIDSISVTFDRDMQKGMSWTGGPPYFPPGDETRIPYWKDKRTCVLPVKLAKGQLFRLGINSKSFTNFRAEGGIPAPPSVICFTTKGAKKSLERRLRVPKIVKLVPQNGAQEIDPKLEALRVTFDMPMGEGFSWTGGGPNFPKIPAGKRPRWSNDGRTCILPVELKPNTSYELGLNSLSHNNFESKWGIPLPPVRYAFATGKTTPN